MRIDLQTISTILYGQTTVKITTNHVSTVR